MAELLLLGTGAALTDGSREPTMLALRGENSTVIIDCGSNVIRQLQRLGVPLSSVERVIVTHEHPDHTSGFALLVEMLWLAGWRGALPVHGPARALDVVRRAFSQWDFTGWEGLPTPEWHEAPPEQGLLVTGRDFELSVAPGLHGDVAVIGIRARDLHGGGSVVYSADGVPSAGIESLARDADLLVHEATGVSSVHSTAAEAGRLARRAGARRLVLVHLSPREVDIEAARREAVVAYGGDVINGEDLQRIPF